MLLGEASFRIIIFYDHKVIFTHELCSCLINWLSHLMLALQPVCVA